MQTLAILASVDFQNLLLNNKERTIGGTSSVIKSILDYLDFKSIILFGVTHHRSELYKEILITPKIKFIPVIYVPSKDFIPSRFHVFFKSRNISHFIKKYKVDVIYSHSMEMSYWLNNKFYIVEHMHGAVNAIKRSKYKILRTPLLIKLWENIRKKVLMKANNIIAIDEACFELASKFNDVKNIHLIRNFVDTKVFFKDETKSEILTDISNKKIVLFVGRIEEVKGLELFIDVVVELNKYQKDWIGVIIGKGTYEDTLKRYIQKRQIKDTIIFPGPVYNQNELRKIYNQAEILLLTSYHEGIPMTILESLACGTPVLSTDVGGISKLTTSEVQCFTLKERDASLFAHNVIKITAMPRPDNREFPYSSLILSKRINQILKNEL